VHLYSLFFFFQHADVSYPEAEAAVVAFQLAHTLWVSDILPLEASSAAVTQPCARLITSRWRKTFTATVGQSASWRDRDRRQVERHLSVRPCIRLTCRPLINMDDIYESCFAAAAAGDNVTSTSITDGSLGCNASLLLSAYGDALLKQLKNNAEIEALRRPWLAAIVIVVYVVVLSFGVLGNGLVFVTVASVPRMRTATNIFIANLALADCFVCAFDLPLNLHYQVTQFTAWIWTVMMK